MRVIGNHELTLCHKEAVEKMLILPKTTRDIGELLSSQLTTERKQSREILLLILKSTNNKNSILRCRDGKRTERRIGMEGICITHSCIPLYTAYMQHIMAHSGGMQEWVIQIPSIPILVSVLFPSLHLE